jgi:DNA replication and repair protein RecF
MFQLNHLSLTQFRNYARQDFVFSERIVGICGNNGTGKTNFLDSIYYLSLTKSYFSRPDQQNVFRGSEGLRVEGNYMVSGKPHKVVCIVRENNKKELSVNDEAYKKFSDHIGRFPTVMIAPDDIELMIGPSEARRKYLDTLLSQIDAPYLTHLIAYNKVLQQRNSLLKSVENGPIDSTLLEVLNQQLVTNGQFIFEKRNEFLKDFFPLVESIYKRIADTDDHITLAYESPLQSMPFAELLTLNFQKDMVLQRTTKGIHRDDLVFTMDQTPFKNEASQGQRKSLLFALKLAEWEILKSKNGFTPILLLDDVFEKLDERRMNQLLQWVCATADGQVFISDTHPQRLEQQLYAINAPFQMIELLPL